MALTSFGEGAVIAVNLTAAAFLSMYLSSTILGWVAAHFAYARTGRTAHYRFAGAVSFWVYSFVAVAGLIVGIIILTLNNDWSAEHLAATIVDAVIVGVSVLLGRWVIYGEY